MNSSGFVYTEPSASLADDLGAQSQPSLWSFSQLPSTHQAGCDSLISGYVDQESVVKDEDNLFAFPNRPHERSTDYFRTSPCKREFDSRQSESDQPQLSIIQLPPTKRAFFDESPLNSLSNSSSDAQSPPDLLAGGNVFTNRAFQIGEDGSHGLRPMQELSEFRNFENDSPFSGISQSGRNARIAIHADQAGGGLQQQVQLPPTMQSSSAAAIRRSGGLQRAHSERVPGQKSHQQDKLLAPLVSPTEQQPLTFQPWSGIQCAPLLEVLGVGGYNSQQQFATRSAEVSFGVQADKGFQFSGRDGVWISQKKNHFQITCIAGVTGEQWAVPVAPYATMSDPANQQQQQQQQQQQPSGSVQLVRRFQLCLVVVRDESPFETPPVGLEQAEANRTRRQFVAQPLPLAGRGVRLRAVAGRLHFSSATLNNQRRRGELHPDQRFFRLVVGLDAVLECGLAVPLSRLISGRIIVRASNPAQFEASAGAAAASVADATEASTTTVDAADGWRIDTPGLATFAGRVGVNTRTPGEALTVHGNLQLHGNLLQPSDARIKTIEDELRPADQLANISRLRIYNYRRIGASMGVEASEVRDTGVIAQEVASVLPDAVRKSSTQRVPTTGEPLLLVNKDRIYMENVGAVKQLGELTASMEKRIVELERMRSKLCRLRDSLRVPGGAQLPGTSAVTSETVESGTGSATGQDTTHQEQQASPAESTRKRSSAACGINVATLVMASLAVISCCFCAAAVLILAEGLRLHAMPSGVSTEVTTSRSSPQSIVSSQPEATGLPLTELQRSTLSGSSLSASTSRTTKIPNNGLIRPDSCSGNICPPIPCCYSDSMAAAGPFQLPINATGHADVAIHRLQAARLASPNIGDWGLAEGKNAKCEATGESGSRLSLQFGNRPCCGSNVTLHLTLDATFPSEAELHLRLETNLTCSYCQPALVQGACPRKAENGRDFDDGVGCVPVAGWGCDCNLGRAAAHQRHLATLRLTPAGLPNSCQMDRGALGQTFLELRLLIQRQAYGCDLQV